VRSFLEQALFCALKRQTHEEFFRTDFGVSYSVRVLRSFLEQVLVCALKRQTHEEFIRTGFDVRFAASGS
jgi:hypothetical protein